MPAIVVADTSCLILLQKIQQLSLLARLYGSVRITPEVAFEFGCALPDWFIEMPLSDQERFALLQSLLDIGEASAISLALEMPGAYLIVDDRKARRIALDFGLRITGTLGILLEAKRNGFLSELKPVLHQVRATNFRLTDEIETKLLTEAGEL